MQKFYSELIARPVVEETTGARIALVRDLLIDPETGKVIAFLLGRNRVIVPLDVRRIGSGIYIEDRDQIVPLDEVMRVHNVYKMEISIIGQKVITENQKIYMGRVVDYEIDTQHMILKSLHVAKFFLFFRTHDALIPHAEIVQITKNAIIVKDIKTATVKEEVPAKSAFAA